MSLPRLGVAIVTMGTRPRELKALLASVEEQAVAATRVMVAGNATPLTDAGGGNPAGYAVLQAGQGVLDAGPCPPLGLFLGFLLRTPDFP